VSVNPTRPLKKVAVRRYPLSQSSTLPMSLTFPDPVARPFSSAPTYYWPHNRIRPAPTPCPSCFPSFRIPLYPIRPIHLCTLLSSLCLSLPLPLARNLHIGARRARRRAGASVAHPHCSEPLSLYHDCALSLLVWADSSATYPTHPFLRDITSLHDSKSCRTISSSDHANYPAAYQ